MTALEDPDILQMDIMCQPVFLFPGPFIPAGAVVDLVHVVHRQSSFPPKGNGKRAFARARAANDHHAFHVTPQKCKEGLVVIQIVQGMKTRNRLFNGHFGFAGPI